MKKKVLFIDRDGTLIKEPQEDFQVDSLEKLNFYPGVFRCLSQIYQELEYELVMVTNQDGLGTDSFPEETFWPAHNKMIEAFKNESIIFKKILIDKSRPEENANTRKPRLGMLYEYVYGDYDLANSYVIGDRNSDMQLAQNLGSKGIFIGETNDLAVLCTRSWTTIYHLLKSLPRKASVVRETKETNVIVNINLDGEGKSSIHSGIGFFDHMLNQIAKHAAIDLDIYVKGDLHVDEHHTVEDVGLAFGTALYEALGRKKSIQRYGFLLPMDDCLAQVAIDFGGRPWLVWEAQFSREKVGDMPTEMFMHFFKSFTDKALCSLNIKAEGDNEHHKIEAIFKGFAKSIRMAIEKTNQFSIPSTKGII